MDLGRRETDSNGNSMLGDSARTLGARLNWIYLLIRKVLLVQEQVVYLFHLVHKIDQHTPEFGGTGKNPIRKMRTGDLGPDLVHVLDKPGHGTIQLARSIPFGDYQSL